MTKKIFHLFIFLAACASFRTAFGAESVTDFVDNVVSTAVKAIPNEDFKATLTKLAKNVENVPEHRSRKAKVSVLTACALEDALEKQSRASTKEARQLNAWRAFGLAEYIKNLEIILEKGKASQIPYYESHNRYDASKKLSDEIALLKIELEQAKKHAGPVYLDPVVRQEYDALDSTQKKCLGNLRDLRIGCKDSSIRHTDSVLNALGWIKNFDSSTGKLNKNEQKPKSSQ